MSLATALRSVLNTRRAGGPVSRAELDMDAGALLTPAVYPYAPGARPVAPFAGRILHPGQGERPRAQLYPPTGNPTQRTFSHMDYAGRAASIRHNAADVSGNGQPAKITRTRPWLYAGSSSATTADKLASGASAAAAAAAGGGCVGCD